MSCTQSNELQLIWNGEVIQGNRQWDPLIKWNGEVMMDNQTLVGSQSPKGLMALIKWSHPPPDSWKLNTYGACKGVRQLPSWCMGVSFVITLDIIGYQDFSCNKHLPSSWWFGMACQHGVLNGEDLLPWRLIQKMSTNFQLVIRENFSTSPIYFFPLQGAPSM